MSLSKKKDNSTSDSIVLLFPAQASLWEGKEILFLFSVHQVIGVLNQDRGPMTSGRSTHIVGKTKWRGNDLPILSLENCLGLPNGGSILDQHIVAIREVYRDEDNELKDLYALCCLGANTRRLHLPFENHPVDVPECIHQPSFLKGVYEMRHSIILVIHLRQILASLTMVEEGPR